MLGPGFGRGRGRSGRAAKPGRKAGPMERPGHDRSPRIERGQGRSGRAAKPGRKAGPPHSSAPGSCPG